MYKNFFKRIIDFTIVFIALLIIWPILLIITIWLHFANKDIEVFCLGKESKILRGIKFKSITDERDATVMFWMRNALSSCVICKKT